MTVTNCLISNNSTIGGHGNAGVNTLMAPGQESGFGFGGGIDNSNGGSEATIINTLITRNSAIGGTGGAGNNGSDGLGGGIGVGWTVLLGSAGPGADGSTVTLISTTLSNNQALGGASSAHNDGGNGYGGGLFVNDTCTASASASSIVFNSALGGEEGHGRGGSDGQGVGGGVYVFSGGAFTPDFTTDIKHNHASTSNDNILG